MSLHNFFPWSPILEVLYAFPYFAPITMTDFISLESCQLYSHWDIFISCSFLPRTSFYRYCKVHSSHPGLCANVTTSESPLCTSLFKLTLPWPWSFSVSLSWFTFLYRTCHHLVANYWLVDRMISPFNRLQSPQ